jgi:hypothetical protein
MSDVGDPLFYWYSYGLPEPLPGACRLDGAKMWWRNPGSRPVNVAAFMAKYRTVATDELVSLYGLPLAWR